MEKIKRVHADGLGAVKDRHEGPMDMTSLMVEFVPLLCGANELIAITNVLLAS